MKKIIIICLLFSSFAKSQVNNVPVAKTFIAKLERHQFDSAYLFFDTTISNKISAAMLEQMWGGFSRFVGDYKEYTNLRCVEGKNGDSAIVALCVFEKGKFDLHLHFTKTSLVDGIFFRQPKSDKAYSSPPYEKSSAFYENKIDLVTGKYKLPGSLLLPNNISNPPMVIMLSGSGPNDKDASIGPNKAFKDIAIGLASNGIASFRYDKRTFVYGGEFSDHKTKITLNEEYIEDALNAVKLLRTNPATKNSKIYLLGHSLGAGCVASVATNAKNISGVVLMAGTARQLEDVVIEQYTYILGLDGYSKEDSLELKDIEKKVATVKNPELLKKASATELPLDMPSEYWQSIKSIVTTKSVIKLKQPVLVMQGGRDYQVTEQDFNLWKTNLSPQAKNKFLFYDNLNHLFMSGKGKAKPAEYEKPGNVEEQVILDLAKWIKEN